MISLPPLIPVGFVLTTALTFVILLWAVLMAFAPHRRGSGMEVVMVVFILLCMWLTVQAWLAAIGFYADEESIPPRLVLAVAPMLLSIAGLFLTRWKKHLDKLPLLSLTLIHTVRIPVEITLLWLYRQGQIPQAMTFEGWNYDIVAGISAPILAYICLIKKWVHIRILLIWNILCLGLLLNIVVIAVLSVASPIQCLAYDQPNEAIKFFPYIWLPSFVVPVVFFSHLASIRLIKLRSTSYQQP